MAENGSRATSAEEGPAIGIDLGTTYSCVGVWQPQHDRVEIIANDLGNRTTPSWVAFTDIERLIGESAQNQAAKNHSNTIFDVKRLMGRKFGDETVQNDMKHWPFKVISGHDDGSGQKPMIAVLYKRKEKLFAAEEISSMILQKMKTVAEIYLGKQVNNAVITVPAYFNNSQRQATKDAGLIAGLNVLRIINEPTAAAYAYGLHNKETANADSALKTILVFDLGGGTFDVSIVTMQKGVFEVKAVNGDTHLGGGDFNNRMVAHFLEEFERKHKKDIRGNPRALARLRAACERAKRNLSSVVETSVDIECLFEGIDFSSSISRARFEKMNMDLFNDCMETVEKCLKDAKMEKSDIHDVVLVGGSTRIPKIQTLLLDFFQGKHLCKSVNPDEAVAYGAAFHAASLNGASLGVYKDIIPLDVVPLSLGIKLHGGEMSVFIPRNSPIPTKIVKDNFAMPSDYPTTCRIGVYEGEMPIAEDNNFLGKFFLHDIPQLPKGDARVNVSFEIDANGILTVSAELAGSSNKDQITITNHSGRLSKKEIDRMVKEAESYKAEDEECKKSREAKNALESYIDYAKVILRTCQSRVGREDMLTLKDTVEKTEQWLQWNNLLSIARKFDEKRVELEIICESIVSKVHPRKGSHTVDEPYTVELVE
ncbi:unnamed protein product [Cuscuta epithymum]|uniref:Heat shock protein 70 n=1 Tax=Cuscuta epithymum TaxID=186058 RepID=A0AAV0DY66_9ASTE|nr:unnamed protein product [Cuscuta epithymum]